MEDLGTEYALEFIVNNPIASRCIKCKRSEPINAPSLENVRCFWCGSRVIAIDGAAYRERLQNLWRHSIPRQCGLFPEATA